MLISRTFIKEVERHLVVISYKVLVILPKCPACLVFVLRISNGQYLFGVLNICRHRTLTAHIFSSTSLLPLCLISNSTGNGGLQSEMWKA